MWLVSIAVASLMALPNVIHVVGDSYQQLSRIRDTTLARPPQSTPRPPTEIILLTSEQAEADVVATGGGDVEVGLPDSSAAKALGVGAAESRDRVGGPSRQASIKPVHPAAAKGDPKRPTVATEPTVREGPMNSGRRIAPQ